MLRKFCYGLAALTTTATAVVAQPANDLCQNATPLTLDVNTPFDTTDATNTLTDVNPLGCLSASDAANNDVWFSFTPDFTGVTRVTFSSSVDRVSIYSACGGTGDLLHCDYFSNTYFAVTAGQTLYIRVSRSDNTAATGNIRVRNPILAQSIVANDFCTNATPLQYDTPVAFKTTFATNTYKDVNPTCLASSELIYPDLWYSYTPNVTGTFPINVVTGGSNPGINPQAKISVYTACGGTGQLLACVDGGGSLDVPGTAGQTVYIRLAKAGAQGSIQVGSSLPPVNDFCANTVGTPRDLFAGVPEAFDTAYATNYPDSVFTTCLTPAQAASNDVWYHHQVNFSAPQGYLYSVTVTPTSPGFIPNVSVYTACNGFALVACAPANVGDVTNGFASRALVKVFNDGITNTYEINIRVGGDDNTPGNGTIEVGVPGPAAPNDDCANAASIADGETISYFNDFATNSGFGSTCPGSDVTADNNFDLWYRFVPNQNGQVTFSTCGSSSPVRLSTYNDACDTQVGCGTTETCSIVNGAFGTITVPATAGTAIRLRVASYLGYVGDIQLHAQFSQGCAADFNQVNGVTVQDIFDFLTAWLAGLPSADFNGVNGVTVQDIFDFLTAWLAGC